MTPHAPSSAEPLSPEVVPALLLADDATSADQAALGVCESLGGRVITADGRSLSRRRPLAGEACIWVVNTGTRAMSPAGALTWNRHLARELLPGAGSRLFVQIDSRLRGIGNALRGLYEALDFDCLLFVPAEIELGRLVRGGIYCHVEDGRLKPFHQSVLAGSAERAGKQSDLLDFIAGELGVPRGHIFSIGEEIVSKGPDAVTDSIRDLKKQGKCVVIPDVIRPEHFEAVIAARKQLGPEKVLLAASRTFLRDYFASLAPGRTGADQTSTLAQAIDRRRRGAPLAVVCSLEPAMNAQMEYARRALGPNLVTVAFDTSVLQAEETVIGRELARVQSLVLHSLSAMRPVLLHSAREEAAHGAAARQAVLAAFCQVLGGGELPRHLSALFLSGGQTAETLREALDISAIEIKGAFQAGIPWGRPLEGRFQHVPVVTKGGRMGSESVLFEFFEQGHPLPRANVLPVVTPLTREKKIDEAGIERLVEHLVRLGTTDLFAVGNAGEFRFLTNEQRLRALEVFARKARGKLRVFAGVTGDRAEETRRNYEAASRLGVYAAVVMPLYFLKSSKEIVPFVESLASTGAALPLVLYNNPERTRGENISFEAVEALEFPVVALKDSSGDLDRLDRYLRALPVYEGQQRQFLEGYQHGARGAVGIIGHVSSLPNEFFAPTTASARRAEIARQINDLSKRVKQGGAEVAAYKFLLSLRGVMGDTVASTEPARELTPAQRERIQAANAQPN